MKNKLLVLALGAAAALLLAETALRLTGFIWSQKAPRPAGAGYTILCLGDSFTFGSGAPKENSYPLQLARLLNSNGQGLEFTVINGGLPGQNTSQILTELAQDLEETKPALVVLLAGGANCWNFFGYHSYRNKSPLARLADRLDTIKIVKLVRLLGSGAAGGGYAVEKTPRERTPLPQCLPSPNNDEILAYYRQAELSAGRGDYAYALTSLKKAALLAPENGYLCWNVAEIYDITGNHAEAGAWREKGRRAPTDCPLNGHVPYFRSESMPLNSLLDWLSHDFGKIIGVCRKKGIPVLMQNYPVKDKSLAHYMPQRYDEIAGKNLVALVDNYPVFKKLTAEGRKLFNTDPFGHCNAEGYGVMAENVAAAIIEAGIFPLDPLPAKAASHNSPAEERP